MATVFTEIRFLKDCAAIVGTDLKTYGPFKEGAVAALPKENASLLIKLGIAESRFAPPKKPTFKEMFKGTVLTPYVEAARTKPLFFDVKKLEDFFYNALWAEGLNPPTKAEAPTNSWWLAFDAKIDANLSMEENEKGLSALVEMIVDQEKRKEIPKVGEEERIEKAREKTEKLLGEIREARGTIRDIIYRVPIQTIRKIVMQHFPDEEVYLGGSQSPRSENLPHKYSDIDFFIFPEDFISFDDGLLVKKYADKIASFPRIKWDSHKIHVTYYPQTEKKRMLDLDLVEVYR